MMLSKGIYNSTFPNQNLTGYVSSSYKGKNGVYKGKDKAGDEVIALPMNLNSAFQNLIKEVCKPARTRDGFKCPDAPAVQPIDRFNKLKESLAEFRVELKGVIYNSLPNSADRLICDALLSQVDDIVIKLEELPKHPTYGSILEPRGAETLPTSMVLQSLKKCTEPLSTAIESETEQTFTIYSKVGGRSSTFANVLKMEARVAHLENDVLGDVMSKEIPFPDLENGIQFLLKRLTTVYRQGVPKLSDLLRSLNEKLQDPNRTYSTHTKDLYKVGVVIEPREDPNHKKIDTLYTKYIRGGSKFDLLRCAVKRIDNLGVAHVALAKLINRVNSAADEHTEVMNSIASYGKTLRDVDENLRRNELQMFRNFKAVSARCENLE